MNEERLNELVKSELEDNVKLDFEDVLKRIEAQKDSFEEEVLPEKNNSAMKTVFRVLAAAASVAVIIGAASLLPSMASGADGGYNMESSAEAPVADSEIVFEDAALPEEEINASDSFGTDENLNINSEYEEKFEPTAVQQTFEIKELGITLDVLDSAACTGRDVPQNFELLGNYGMTEGELEAAYRRNDIYFNAVWKSDEITTELVVYMEEDDGTWALFDMNLLSDEELALRVDEFENYDALSSAEDGVDYYDCSVFRHRQAVFIRAYCKVDNEFTRENRLEYTTVINGKRYIFLLIEHPVSKDVIIDDRISADNESMMKEIIDSVEWSEIKNAMWERYKSFIPAAILVLLITAVIIAAVIIETIKKKQKAEAVQDEITANDSDCEDRQEDSRSLEFEDESDEEKDETP